jgi:hypothetical protein
MSAYFAHARRLLLVFLLGLGGGIAHAANIVVQILSFNDFHGNIEPPAGSDAKMRQSEDPLQNDLGNL